MSPTAVGSGNTLTYTEVHAAIVGVAVGAVAAYVEQHGFPGVGVALAALFVGLALGVDIGGRTAAGARTLRREPWYGLGAFVLAGALTLAIA
ncbi:hypothetical protein U3A55_02760 [Salarchaeum sp. III]|uniref:hypothetical protein n=1 Tax=Salarchaeum sp. III TaxID=3107927 RepID=UPI002EDB4FB3